MAVGQPIAHRQGNRHIYKVGVGRAWHYLVCVHINGFVNLRCDDLHAGVTPAYAVYALRRRNESQEKNVAFLDALLQQNLTARTASN